MQVEIFPRAEDANERAAEIIAQKIVEAVADRGRCTVALSGGSTPARMMRSLALAELPWTAVHLLQVDERVVAIDDSRRNLIAMRDAFAHSPLPRENMHAMPVETTPAEAAAAQYCETLAALAGRPPRIDIVQLGLGEDGHTASLVPGDPALEADEDVAITAVYKGTKRMSLSLEALDRARCRLWLITGSAKRDIVHRFLARDPALVASRVSTRSAIVVLDEDAGRGQRAVP